MCGGDTVIVGLGNPILGDDAAGIHAVRRLRDLLVAWGARAVEGSSWAGRPVESFTLGRSAPVHLAEVCAGALDLLETLLGFDRAMVVDAWAAGRALCGSQSGMDGEEREGRGVQPGAGAIRILTVAQLKAAGPPASLHQLHLPTALQAAARMGLPVPQEVELWTIGVTEVGFREGCTPPVRAAAEEVARTLFSRILLLPGESARSRRRPTAPQFAAPDPAPPRFAATCDATHPSHSSRP